MLVRKVKGRQLARYIALIYIILWVLFIIFMVVRFKLNELLDIDLLIPLIVTTIVNISLSLIIYLSSYKIISERKSKVNMSSISLPLNQLRKEKISLYGYALNGIGRF